MPETATGSGTARRVQQRRLAEGCRCVTRLSNRGSPITSNRKGDVPSHPCMVSCKHPALVHLPLTAGNGTTSATPMVDALRQPTRADMNGRVEWRDVRVLHTHMPYVSNMLYECSVLHALISWDETPWPADGAITSSSPGEPPTMSMLTQKRPRNCIYHGPVASHEQVSTELH
ncbi:hypothetical protein N658DRAFT_204795 [Parathielavia hyrcaniae]|uniref:Uncharacterized protein n=1 Tax=Parathielavia hyrcaniae TaxID=113614 RepID=A0AAN6Q0M7_9PEZI|nr:hypothetical protein N658DRAFT_204795 [Parathielavia hyrcaniae]